MGSSHITTDVSLLRKDTRSPQKWCPNMVSPRGEIVTKGKRDIPHLMVKDSFINAGRVFVLWHRSHALHVTYRRRPTQGHSHRLRRTEYVKQKWTSVCEISHRALHTTRAALSSRLGCSWNVRNVKFKQHAVRRRTRKLLCCCIHFYCHLSICNGAAAV